MRENWHNLRLIALHRLPPMLYGRCVDPNAAVPVFAQHAPGGSYLKPKLEHLARNKYSTLTTREYLEWLSGTRTLDRPSVLLTFDDGLKGFADHTLPLLRQHGMRSVLFICPGLVEMATRPAGKAGEQLSKTLLSWGDIRGLAGAGDVDVQSHGMWHNRVPNGPHVEGDGLGDLLQMLREEVVGRACIGAPYLGGLRWDLRRQAAAPFFACAARPDSPVTPQALGRDLAEAKRLIETNLPGHVVEAMAFPWWRGSPDAIGALENTGYRLALWGLSGVGPRLGRNHVDAFHVGRLGFDWISCLPGAGRLSVTQVLVLKSRRQQDDRR